MSKRVTKYLKKQNIRTGKNRAPRAVMPKNPRKDPNIFSVDGQQAGPFLPEGPAGPTGPGKLYFSGK